MYQLDLNESKTSRHTTHPFCAIIVTYNPNIETISLNVKKLISQGFYVLVVDNNSDIKIEIDSEMAETIVLDKNYGIAKALNVGMYRAKDYEARWVLSLDQDTDFASNILDEYKKNLNLQKVGALSPMIVRKGIEHPKHGAGIEKISVCPTSGFFINLDIWEKCGMYDEWMFIDYVDYDMCMKLISNGYSIYRINTTYIVQNLGEMQTNKLFYKTGELLKFKKLQNFSVVYNHSPFRNYYFVRNSLYFRYKYRGLLDLKYERGHLIRWELKKLILEKHKIANLIAIYRGIRDFYKIKDSIV